MLYHSLVYPHLNYVTQVWGSADPTYLNRIQNTKIQNTKKLLSE